MVAGMETWMAIVVQCWLRNPFSMDGLESALAETACSQQLAEVFETLGLQQEEQASPVLWSVRS
jgi:hypothetical protein